MGSGSGAWSCSAELALACETWVMAAHELVPTIDVTSPSEADLGVDDAQITDYLIDA